MSSSNRKNIIAHLFFWVSLLTLLLYFRSFIYTNTASLLVVNLTEIISFASSFYITLLILIPKFYERNHYIRYVLSLIVLIVFFAIVRSSVENLHIESWLMGRVVIKERLFVAKIISSLIIVGTSHLYYSVRRSILSQNRESELQKAKLQAEINVLKAKIDPHFLFNTLGNIHSLAFMNSTQTADMLMKLSELMRYMLYESDEKQVSMKKEIEFIENYIELQQMRLQNKQNVTLNFQGKTNAVRVSPLLFISFIENAFKHSNIYTDGFITIDFRIDSKKIEFEIKNSFKLDKLLKNKADKSEKYSGFGLENTKNRLNLLYPNAYELKIEQKNDIFIVNLNLKLQ